MIILSSAKSLNVYRGTLTGLRISSVDDTAFIDNAGATIPALADGLHRIEIYDSAWRQLSGYLKAAGTGETLGDNLYSSWSNHVSMPFDTLTTSGLDVTSGISDGSSVCVAWASIAVSAGDLVKLTTDFTLNSGSLTEIRLSSAADTATPELAIIANPQTAAQSVYKTVTADSEDFFILISVGAVNFAMTSTAFKQVTAPSTSGATIVNSREGTVYRFAGKNASFAYNEASYFVVVRKLR